MPTPVSTARQCLTDDTARALDDAVDVARRRSHAQTTSLHAVSSLLALPSSTLRDACSRARSTAYSLRLQFRALELSIGVSLDRLPSSSKAQEEPPVSNSLMAAIRRSQATQRRHPDTFYLYQQMQQQNPSSTTTSCVKVELKHFILSILDDPIVSRVFGEAGFRSCDIKLAIVNPPTFSRFSPSRRAPMFLCNLPGPELNRRGFNFPFAGFPGFENSDENTRRIREILVKKKAKNPLLLGVCANDALSSFAESIQRGKSGVLPKEIEGLKVVCIEMEISDFVVNGGSDEQMGLKFKELGDMLEQCTGSGIVVNYGDLKIFVDDQPADAVKFVVSGLSKLVETHGEKLWLIGATESYKTYMKHLACFPSIENDWDLHLLPITSSKPSLRESYPRSSLMGSFVPFAGFFSTPPEFGTSTSTSNLWATRCDLCNAKYEEEVSLILKGEPTDSVAYQHSAGLSSWLQMSEYDATKRVDVLEAKDVSAVSSARIVGLQRKWTDICQRLHQTQSVRWDDSLSGYDVLEFLQDRKQNSGGESSPYERRYTDFHSFMPTDLKRTSLQENKRQISVISDAENTNFQTKPPVEISKIHQLEMHSSRLPIYPVQNWSAVVDHMSSSSSTSVATDLGLGTLYAFSEQEASRSKLQDHRNCLHQYSGSVSAELNRNCEKPSNHIAQSPSFPDLEVVQQFDAKNSKDLWKALAEKVSWQEEAISTINQSVSRCRSGHGKRYTSKDRADIWLSFLGPDKVGKKRVAAALAEIIFGSRESLISVDLSSENGISSSDSIFNQEELQTCYVKFRGKTVVDYIAEEMSKKPHSVALLENVDKADFLVQNSLLQAIRTGRFCDSHGREISICNTIFVTTTGSLRTKKDFLHAKESPEFSEEQILGAKRLQMQIIVECIPGDLTRTNGSNVSVVSRQGTSNLVSINKRKLANASDSTEQEKSLELAQRLQKVPKTCLDLNFPVEEIEDDDDYANCESDSFYEYPEAWLEDFLYQVDERVVFKIFDFDTLGKKILKDIGFCLQRTLGSKVLLEIDSEVMVQMLAAAWLADRKRAVEDWVEEVLCRSFLEAKQKYCLISNSIIKLVPCEGVLLEETAPGVCLPARVSLN